MAAATVPVVSRSHLNSHYPQMNGEFLYKGCHWVSWTTEKRIRKIETEFVWRPDDILIATYPKSGTTLLEEMTWLLLHQGDFPGAKSQPIFARVPFLEENYLTVYPDGAELGQYPLDYAPTMPHSAARLLKTHLPYRHLQNGVDQSNIKTMLCIRNPKDTLVSYYHFYRGTEDYGPYAGSFNDFWTMWMDGWIVGGDWLDVIPEWWKLRRDGETCGRSNILYLFYEDLVRHPRTCLRSIQTFLNLPSLGEATEEAIVQHCSFESMRSNPMTNYTNTQLGFTEEFQFMRRGKIGDWKNWFTVAQNEQFNEKYNPRLAELNLPLEFE